MVTTLYLVRHGETAGGDAGRYHGSIDIPLSGKGISQIKEAADHIRRLVDEAASSFAKSYLREVQPDTPGSSPEHTKFGAARLRAVYCSDLIRARKSAEIIAAPHKLDCIALPELRERDFGIWEGMSFTEIKEKYPAEFDAWATNPLKFSPINGENTLQVRERVISALEKILTDHQGENIAVVAHGGVNRIILCHILGIPLENIFRIEQGHAAVNIIEFWDRYPVVKLLNG
jgi:broad specificity phosphatase PhoE